MALAVCLCYKATVNHIWLHHTQFLIMKLLFGVFFPSLNLISAQLEKYLDMNPRVFSSVFFPLCIKRDAVLYKFSLFLCA